MSDKDFKVKNKLQVKGITSAGPVVSDAAGNLDSTAYVATQYGGTGTSTSPTSGQILYSASGTTYAPTDLTSLVGGFPSTAVSSNITLAKNNKYFVNTGAARTLTLPASPSLGDEIYVFDASGTAATYNITIARNGNLINANAGNFIINANGASISLFYTGDTYGWKVG